MHNPTWHLLTPHSTIRDNEPQSWLGRIARYIEDPSNQYTPVPADVEVNWVPGTDASDFVYYRKDNKRYQMKQKLSSILGICLSHTGDQYSNFDTPNVTRLQLQDRVNFFEQLEAHPEVESALKSWKSGYLIVGLLVSLHTAFSQNAELNTAATLSADFSPDMPGTSLAHLQADANFDASNRTHRGARDTLEGQHILAVQYHKVSMERRLLTMLQQEIRPYPRPYSRDSDMFSDVSFYGTDGKGDEAGLDSQLYVDKTMKMMHE